MLKQRIITALILVSVLLAALLVNNPIWWRTLISIFLLVGFWEWLRFCDIVGLVKQAACFSLFLLVFTLLQIGYVPLVSVVFVSCTLWVGLLIFTMTDRLDFLHQRFIKLSIGVWVLSVAGTLIIELKNLDNGSLWVLCFMVSVWAADIGAYFVGRRFGKTKLAPKVSPGKTVEGLFGGLAFVLLIFIPILLSIFSPQQALLLLLTVVITALVSVGGDLFESKLKRYAKLKDSSQVLPGHGGVLDRVDSLLSGAPFFTLGLIALGIFT